MTELIIGTAFLAVGVLAIMLFLIGTLINCLTDFSTNLDIIGCWLFVLWLGLILISLFVGLIIVLWR